MTKKIVMYPTKVTQPDWNQSTGLQNTCFKAVRRNGTSYKVNCKDQKDPKYYHEWSNAEEICKGNTIQCGRPSTKNCSHKTYKNIKGYRNTCPIAGVTGTYTQPGRLRLYFDIQKKGIKSTDEIKSITLSFKHRCTGVDVANGKEYTSWGPNFSGKDIYPNRKALTVKLVGTKTQKQILNENPPLSKKFSSTGNFTFEKVTYEDIQNGYIDIIYGNNLETNPGNIYIKDLKLTVEYSNPVQYITGTQSAKTLNTSDNANCRSTITFTIEAGYKSNGEKISPNDAPKKLNESIIFDSGNKNITAKFTKNNDGKTTKAVVTDATNKTGTKKVTFTIKGTNEKKTFKYTAVKKSTPDIKIPLTTIQKNTAFDEKTASLIVTKGCVSKITVYYSCGENCFQTLCTFNTFENADNIISIQDQTTFYEALSQLNCGTYAILFVLNDDNFSNAIRRTIKVIPAKYKIVETNSNIPLPNDLKFTLKQNAQTSINLKFDCDKELLEGKSPIFIISNPTISNNSTAIEPTVEWNTADTTTINVTIGAKEYGSFKINISDKEEKQNCVATNFDIPIEITKVTNQHQQYYDEIFVRGEDSTAFNYEYLVALEGDSVKSPLTIQSITPVQEFSDITICTTQSNYSGLGEIKTIPLKITNNSSNDIDNLFLELNALIKDENDEYQVTTAEWLETDGIFYNFIQNFEAFNKENEHLISIKNLTPDDDYVDEEDVYIHVKKIQKNHTLKINIPFKSHVAKKVGLQILLFGNKVFLYDCDDNTKRFDTINLNVYDSVLTEMLIEGETDYFETHKNYKLTENGQERQIVGLCPNECFLTENGITYTVKNIDTSSLTNRPKIIINNDPRLIPYKWTYNKKNYYDVNSLPKSIINYLFNENAYNYFDAGELEVTLTLKIPNHDEIKLYKTTDGNGELTFFIPLPVTFNETTISNLMEYALLECGLNNYYNLGTLKGNSYTGDYLTDVLDDSKITPIISYNNDGVHYYGGQTVPLRVKVTGKEKYIQNEIVFYPNILNPNQVGDKLTVYYKACNLPENTGILETKMKTDDDEYKLIPNSVEEKLYFGVKPTTQVYSKLTKELIQNKSINRLNIALVNKNRANKDVVIYFEERDRESKVQRYLEIYNEEKNTVINSGRIEVEDIGSENYIKVTFLSNNHSYYISPEALNGGEHKLYTNTDGSSTKYFASIKEKVKSEGKYEILDYSLDIGKITIDDDNIIKWEIDYIEPNTTITGFIDYKAKEIGQSKISVTITDFTSANNYLYGKASYKCECRNKLE